jgi:hypothetical protein
MYYIGVHGLKSANTFVGLLLRELCIIMSVCYNYEFDIRVFSSSPPYNSSPLLEIHQLILVLRREQAGGIGNMLIVEDKRLKI